MRYPYEVNLVGDAAATLRALIPLLKRKDDRSWREGIEATWRAGGSRWTREAEVEADPINPMLLFRELSPRLPENAIVTADSGSSANWYARAPEVPRRHARLAVGQPGHHGPRRPVRHRRQVRPPGPARHRVRRRRRHADERPGRADHHQALLGAVVRPAADRRGPAQQRPEPGHLGDAGDGRRAQVRRIPAAPRRRLRRVRPQPRPERRSPSTTRASSARPGTRR